MKVLVAVKRVVDYKAIIRIKSDESDVDTSQVKMSMNPFDEIAVEEAVRLKEKGIVSEILAVSVGQSTSQETLRTALAMGCDRAVLLETPLTLQPLAISKLLKSIAIKEAVSFVLLGKQAIDSDDNQVGQMLAGLLNWPQATFASVVHYENGEFHITREIDGGLETLRTSSPLVITTDLRLNEPRYIALPNIVQAKRKPLEVISVDTLNVDVTPRFKLLSVKAPEKRRSGTKLNSMSELVNKLKNEAQVIS